MNKQLITRGASVSITAIAASVFLAEQFLVDKVLVSSGGSVPTEAVEIRVASVADPYSGTVVSQDVAAEVDFSALETPDEKMSATGSQHDFQPKLTFVEQTMPSETSLCSPSISVAPAIDGLVELHVSAPCRPGEPVVISHGDLAFSETLDQAGSYWGYLPALSANVTVDVFMSDDTILQAETRVPDFDLYARVIVQWDGPETIALNAYHDGAQFGGSGHIHASNPFDPALEDAFLVAFGDPLSLEPMLAQVYSVPLAKAGSTRLQLELAATEQTCGADLLAYVLSTPGAPAGQHTELRVAMPSCEAGDALVILDLPFEPRMPTVGLLESTSDQS